MKLALARLSAYSSLLASLSPSSGLTLVKPCLPGGCQTRLVGQHKNCGFSHSSQPAEGVKVHNKSTSTKYRISLNSIPSKETLLGVSGWRNVTCVIYLLSVNVCVWEAKIQKPQEESYKVHLPTIFYYIKTKRSRRGLWPQGIRGGVSVLAGNRTQGSWQDP